ncbi:MAG: TIGR00296 family protein [Nanoarchaeota archaeon]|nr:TIGR00296 family protein [Nanoarchaeota archaeon]
MILEEGIKLVKLAREAIDASFTKNTIDFSQYKEKRGVFVTLHKEGKLRGCIGFPEPVYPLGRAIVESARSAAFKDPRFEPVTHDELADIDIEVSVLTMPELIEVEKPEEYLDKIEIGKHGLIIKHIYRSGLLLPQVFTEYESTPKEALEMLCEKAGLDHESWQDPEVQIYSFEAEIFAEKEPNGEIIRS